MPLYTSRTDGHRAHLIPLRHAVTEDSLSSVQPMKVLVIKGKDSYANEPNRQVETKLEKLGHKYLVAHLYDINPLVLDTIREYDRVVINMNTLTDSERESLFKELLILRTNPNVPPVIAYTDGKTYPGLERTAVKGGPVDLLLAPYGGPFSTSGFPTDQDLQAALELTKRAA